MTVCNMTIEGGGRAGMIAPDDTTFAWLEGRPAAPADLEAAVEQWRGLRTDDGAAFDREIVVDAGALSPLITWGTNPAQVVGVGDRVPEPAGDTDERALRYMALEPGTPMQDVRLDRVFIGSCTNARIGDLRAAARVVEGRTRVARRAGDGRARLRAGARAGRGRGPGPRVHRRRLRLAHRGLLDVPGHEPGHPRAGRALRLDLEPQLRGPPGARRAHPPRLAARWPPRPPSRATSSTSKELERSGARRSSAAVSVLDRADVDTDQIIPKQFLKRVERTGFGSSCSTTGRRSPAGTCPPTRSSPPGRTSAAAPAASTRRGRCRTTASGPSCRRASPTSSSPTARRSGCCPSCCPTPRCAP